MPDMTVSVEQAGQILGVGRHAAYVGCRNGQIPSIRVGRRIRVPLHALARLLQGQEPAGTRPVRRDHLNNGGGA
jgi:excisionase family DNA binding protein